MLAHEHRPRRSEPPPRPRRSAPLEARFTRDAALVREAQALRHRVLAETLGTVRHDDGTGLDTDHFDRHCDHLVVREADGRVVATYRLLPPSGAWRAGGYAADDIFEMDALEELRPHLVELDRMCVHPAYRGAAVSQLFWGELARYLLERGHDHVICCVPIGMSDGGHIAASLHRKAAALPGPDDLRIAPRRALPLEALRDSLPAKMPSLLRACLDNGAFVCGAPAWDRAFDCAQLPLLLPLTRMRTRVLRRFLAAAA